MRHPHTHKKCENPEYIIFYNGPRYGPVREAGESGPARTPSRTVLPACLLVSGGPPSGLLPYPAGNGVEQGVSSGLLHLSGLQPVRLLGDRGTGWGTGGGAQRGAPEMSPRRTPAPMCDE